MSGERQISGPILPPLVRLQGFTRYALDHDNISAESAERLQILHDEVSFGLFDPDIRQALTKRELPHDIPPIPTLRCLTDFTIGQSVKVIVGPDENFYATSIGDIEGSYLRTRAGGSLALKQLAAPSYVGLITNEEYQAYQFKRKGGGGRDGTPMSYIYTNTEFARILAELGFGSKFDFGVITTIRRHFRVSTHQYRPFKVHLAPLTEGFDT